LLIAFHANAWNDYLYWQQTDKQMLRKINRLIEDASRHPFSGIGKPEPLKHELSGTWSRRIDGEHRLVYQWREDGLVILQCRYHY
jgi:toxin YoeB